MLMKNLNTLTLLVLALVMSAVTSCSEDDELIIPVPQHMTEQYVMETLNGKGWQYFDSHEIKSNGTVERKEYWAERYGGGPSEYKFSGDTITTFSYIDSEPISGYKNSTYSYNEATNQLMAGGKEVFKIISLSENILKMIKYQGIDGNGNKIYVYYIYTVMSSDDLAECIKNHPYDLDSLNDKYPMIPEQMRITPEYFGRYGVGDGWKCTEAHKLEMAGRYHIDNIYNADAPDMPANFFIDNGTITWLPNNAGTADYTAKKENYTYRANGFYIEPAGGNGFRIITLNNYEMKIIKKQREGNGGAVREFYCVYRKMTPEELKLYMANS